MRAIFFFFISLMPLATLAQQSDTIYLWPNEVPGETSPKHPAVQTDNVKNNVIRLTDVTDPTLVVFKPKASIDNGQSMIVCPGGGYSILAIDLEGYEIAEWLNGLGYTVYVLQYRVPKKKEQALYDAQRAIRIVRSKSNPDTKIGILGFSAGGSLSARASTLYNMETYKKDDDIDLLSAKPDYAVLIYPAYLDQGDNRSLTPELQIDSITPPMFIFATADDGYANSALVMSTALRDAKIPVELHMLPTGGHGYGLRSGNVAAETWPKLAEVWLQKMITEK